MNLFLTAALPVIVVAAVAATVVALAVRRSGTAARTSRMQNVMMRALEVCLLISGVAMFVMSGVGVARGTAVSEISVASGVLLACWFLTMRARRHRERR